MEIKPNSTWESSQVWYRLEISYLSSAKTPQVRIWLLGQMIPSPSSTTLSHRVVIHRRYLPPSSLLLKKIQWLYTWWIRSSSIIPMHQQISWSKHSIPLACIYLESTKPKCLTHVEPSWKTLFLSAKRMKWCHKLRWPSDSSRVDRYRYLVKYSPRSLLSPSWGSRLLTGPSYLSLEISWIKS